MPDSLEWFLLWLWVPCAGLFLLLAAAAWLAPRRVRLRVHASWRRQSNPTRPDNREQTVEEYQGMALLLWPT